MPPPADKQNNPSSDELEMETRNLIEHGKRSFWKPVALLAGVVILLLIGRMSGIAHYVVTFKSWILSQGRWGYVIFSFTFVLLTTTAVPASILTLLAGVVYGTVHGIILANICATITAAISFFIARYFAYEDTFRLINRKPRLKKLYQMTQRHEVLTVVLIRFIPLFPFNLINYGFGISPISFRTYIFWTWLCMIPGTVIFVAGGDVIMETIFHRNFPTETIIIIVIAFALVITSIFFAYRFAINYFQTK